MKNLIILLISAWILLGCLYENLWAWDHEITHKDLTEQAVYKSSLDPSNDIILKYFGFDNGFNEKLNWPNQVCDDKTHQTNCSIKDWLKYGAEKEDAEISQISGRFNNHFHNPRNGEGIDDWELGIYPVTDESNLEWAQDSPEQNLADAPYWPEGDQSWPTLRGLYKEALTAVEDTDRQAKFARLFKGLGHQMHLVQDMAVPAHVRNDSHPWETPQASDNWGEGC